MKSILQNFQPISLDEMSGVKLLNRTDTKFVTSLNQLRKLLSMAEHDYRVQEINGQRIAHYYSTYFDTPTNDMYMRHQNGHQNRQKLRIRSYVDSHLNFLEVKTKNNHGRTKKKRIPIVQFDPLHPNYQLRFGTKNNPNANIVAIDTKTTNAVLNILCAPLLSPIVLFSDTSFEIVLGIPIVAIASINVYT